MRLKFSPHAWGCSGPRHSLPLHRAVLPTRVGMFRTRSAPCGQPGRSPHTRGDVPRLLAFAATFAAFSPRPWGCSVALRELAHHDVVLPTPVGMFRTSALTVRSRRCSPHARGDVPANMETFVTTNMFSPRPWGCSGEHGDVRHHEHVLPTPVGMFRHFSTGSTDGSSSPHARGDVPEQVPRSALMCSFSPHAWGCSVPGLPLVDNLDVLPTRVGMFRQ